MEPPNPSTHETSLTNQVEEFSRSTSLTVFEIHRSAESIIPSYLLANMMSPLLWQWRESRPMHSPDGILRRPNRRLKDLQRQFHWYTFTNDMSKPGGDYWGLLHFDEEEDRLGKEFIRTIRKDYDETLRYLLDLDPGSQFGQIVEQDFYKQGYFPRLKNETIEGMNAYQRICPMGKGSGKCVALAMLWASALSICARFPLDKIIIVANKAHLFVFLDDEETFSLFNNAKWYNSTRIKNGSELAVQAQSVATGSDVMFIYIPGKGMCDIYNGVSQVERETIEEIGRKCSDFLGEPLKIGDLDQVKFAVNETSLPDPNDFDSQESYKESIYELAEDDDTSVFAHAKYAYRDWKSTEPHVYAHAAMREYGVTEKAQTINCIDDAFGIVNAIEDRESIFQSRDRIALPDETMLFNSGDDRDRALLLYSLLFKSEIETEKLMVAFGEKESYIQLNNIWINAETLEQTSEKPDGLTHFFNHLKTWIESGSAALDEPEEIALDGPSIYEEFATPSVEVVRF